MTLREKVRATDRLFRKAYSALVDVEREFNFEGFPVFNLPVANFAPGGEFFLAWGLKELEISEAIKLMETNGRITPSNFT